ncbi:hypothetical protein BJP37_30430 [Moorena bouillonii PNG]|uniref:Uncharacterized protein n=2 Tax=Coleofasciculaceae TaxID=1892251 RepID=A0A1U7N9U9_9CYAN|nr:hypothetical protein BJP37_30430 [Moorena bouillonii PNG]
MFIELILLIFFIIKYQFMAELLNSQDTCTQEDSLAIRIGIVIIFDAIFPIPDSRFPTPDSRFPTPFRPPTLA